MIPGPDMGGPAAMPGLLSRRSRRHAGPVTDLPPTVPRADTAPARWPPEPVVLHAIFEAQAQRRPEAIAIDFGGETMTYRELDRCSNQIARHLRARGVGRGSRV